MAFTDDDISSLKASLASHGQEHLLQWWDELSSDQKTKLYQDITSVDLQNHLKSYTVCMRMEQNKSGKEDDLQPLPSDAFESVFVSTEDNERWTKLGLKEISDGRVALLLMAGGQGTRLGVKYPKGMYKVGLQSGKSLYQLHAERIQYQENRAREMYGSTKPLQWYIMTSDHTREATVDYFNSNNWFGLSEDNVIFFEQEMIPCVGLNGKILLDTKYSLTWAPGGNGDLYRAMGNEGVLAHMLKMNIRSVHCYAVDNILVKVPDPLFIGCCLERYSDCGAKIVSKAYPTEAVGVICKCNGKWKVVEYSEISSETAHLTGADGKLLYSQGSICNHYFTTDFLKQIIEQKEKELIHHVARKCVPTIDAAGQRIIPKAVNGMKMEKFVFDVFQFSQKFTVLEVNRKEEFSPLKNGPGSEKCCPQTCLEDLSDLHKQWITNANGTLLKGGICEISPLISSAGENLENFVANKTLKLPLHLEPPSISNGHHSGLHNGFYSKL